jgi:hypothetical protein
MILSVHASLHNRRSTYGIVRPDASSPLERIEIVYLLWVSRFDTGLGLTREIKGDTRWKR